MPIQPIPLQDVEVVFHGEGTSGRIKTLPAPPCRPFPLAPVAISFGPAGLLVLVVAIDGAQVAVVRSCFASPLPAAAVIYPAFPHDIAHGVRIAAADRVAVVDLALAVLVARKGTIPQFLGIRVVTAAIGEPPSQSSVVEGVSGNARRWVEFAAVVGG
jgi:hypothetical protein